MAEGWVVQWGAAGTFASRSTRASTCACCPCSLTRSRRSSYPTASAPATTEVGDGAMFACWRVLACRLGFISCQLATHPRSR